MHLLKLKAHSSSLLPPSLPACWFLRPLNSFTHLQSCALLLYFELDRDCHHVMSICAIERMKRKALIPSSILFFRKNVVDQINIYFVSS